MANTKSAIKETRKTVTNTARNLAAKTRLKTLTKQAREALAGDDQEAASKAVSSLISAYDKAVKSNIVHKNKASRYKASFAAALAAKSWSSGLYTRVSDSFNPNPLFATLMGNLKKKRRLKMNKHKRRKRAHANRHKKRTW